MKNLPFLIVLLLLGMLQVSTAQAQKHCYAATKHRSLTTSGGEKELAALIAKSPVILEGHAEEGNCFWDAAHLQIYTATPVTVYKVFKGEVSSTRVEIITWGGQVGNSGAAGKSQVGLALHPTGMFFLAPASHPDPKTKTPSNQVFSVVDGRYGFFKYEGIVPDFDKTSSRWQLYPHLETSLYPVITTQVGHSYRVVKPFDPKTFNYIRQLDILDSLAYREGQNITVPPIIKKNYPQNKAQALDRHKQLQKYKQLLPAFFQTLSQRAHMIH